MIDTNKNTEHSPKWITITGIVTKPYFEELMDGREPFHDVKWDIQEYDEDTPKLLAEVKRLREQGRKLIEAAERVRSDISDQDTGWYYQLGNHIEKMNRLVKNND